MSGIGDSDCPSHWLRVLISGKRNTLENPALPRTQAKKTTTKASDCRSHFKERLNSLPENFSLKESL
jgi:hypothetical protein